MLNPSNILITGASNGIGKALAIKYSRPGIKLFLTGRDQARLDHVAQLCQQKGAEISSFSCDVRDNQTLLNWIYKCDDKAPVDLVIANAGISAGTGGGDEKIEQVTNIFSTNINGVLNTIYPAIERMKQRQSGQIAIISSLAGYRGLPSSPAYSASKAAVKILGEGLRGHLAKYNIEVTVVTPGYIKTDMTAMNNFYMPFLMNVEKAAEIIVNKLQKNPARIAFPWPLYFIVWLITLLPPFITDPILNLLPGKAAQDKN